MGPRGYESPLKKDVSLDTFTRPAHRSDGESVPIRLGIVGLPRLLADVIADAFRDDDAVSIEHLPASVPLELTDDGVCTHEVLIIGVTDPWQHPVLAQISRSTRPKLFGVRTDGRESWVYRMQPCPQRLGPVNTAQIRAAVLASAEPNPHSGDLKGPA